MLSTIPLLRAASVDTTNGVAKVFKWVVNSIVLLSTCGHKFVEQLSSLVEKVLEV